MKWLGQQWPWGAEVPLASRESKTEPDEPDEFNLAENIWD